MRVLLIFLFAVTSFSMVTSKPDDLSFGLCIDTSRSMLRVVQNIKNGMQQILAKNRFSDYVVVPFFVETIESANPTDVQNFIKIIDVHDVDPKTKHALEYHRLRRAIELSRRNGVIFFFTDTISNYNARILKLAEDKELVLHYFVVRCCLSCTARQLRLHSQIVNRGHGIYCISPADALNIFQYVSMGSTTVKDLRSPSTFTKLLTKLSFAYALEISKQMKSQIQTIGLGIKNIVVKAPAHLLNYGVMSNKTVFRYHRPSDVLRSFSKLQYPVVTSNIASYLLNERLRKSIELSSDMSIIYSFTPTLSNMPDSAVFDKANQKQISMHFFLTNCTAAVNQLKIQFEKMHHGVYCLKPSYLERLMTFIPKEISRKPLVIHPLRLKSTYLKLFTDVIPTLHPPTAVTTTTSEKKPSEEKFVKVPYVKVPLLPHIGRGIIINNNITFPVRHGCKCGSAKLQTSNLVKIFILTKLISTIGFC